MSKRAWSTRDFIKMDMSGEPDVECRTCYPWEVNCPNCLDSYREPIAWTELFKKVKRGLGE